MIIMLRRFILTSLSMLRPAAATMPNITITPPPKTGKGIDAISAPIFGIRPHMIKKIAPIVTTWRLIIPVIPTIPTFWLKEVFGKPPKTAAAAVPKPSAYVAPEISSSVASRPAPAFVVADTSPTVSIAETMETNVTANTAQKLNSKPYGSGLIDVIQFALETAPKFTIPMKYARM